MPPPFHLCVALPPGLRPALPAHHPPPIAARTAPPLVPCANAWAGRVKPGASPARMELGVGAPTLLRPHEGDRRAWCSARARGGLGVDAQSFPLRAWARALVGAPSLPLHAQAGRGGAHGASLSWPVHRDWVGTLSLLLRVWAGRGGVLGWACCPSCVRGQRGAAHVGASPLWPTHRDGGGMGHMGASPSWPAHRDGGGVGHMQLGQAGVTHAEGAGVGALSLLHVQAERGGTHGGQPIVARTQGWGRGGAHAAKPSWPAHWDWGGRMMRGMQGGRGETWTVGVVSEGFADMVGVGLPTVHPVCVKRMEWGCVEWGCRREEGGRERGRTAK
ncbi:hypothetical protein H4582DRAFT_2059335 [Lactarius indigo]|nr:hypothetical protein H4582DRAFT_2059335 [Lactarius indigo]